MDKDGLSKLITLNVSKG